MRFSQVGNDFKGGTILYNITEEGGEDEEHERNPNKKRTNKSKKSRKSTSQIGRKVSQQRKTDPKIYNELLKINKSETNNNENKANLRLSENLTTLPFDILRKRLSSQSPVSKPMERKSSILLVEDKIRLDNIPEENRKKLNESNRNFLNLEFINENSSEVNTEKSNEDIEEVEKPGATTDSTAVMDNLTPKLEVNPLHLNSVLKANQNENYRGSYLINDNKLKSRKSILKTTKTIKEEEEAASVTDKLKTKKSLFFAKQDTVSEK